MTSSHHRNRLFLAAYSNDKIHLVLSALRPFTLQTWRIIFSFWRLDLPLQHSHKLPMALFVSSGISAHPYPSIFVSHTLGREHMHMHSCRVFDPEYLFWCQDKTVTWSLPAASKLSYQGLQTPKQLLCSQLLQCKLHFPAARDANLARLCWRETYLLQ